MKLDQPLTSAGLRKLQGVVSSKQQHIPQCGRTCERDASVAHISKIIIKSSLLWPAVFQRPHLLGPL